MKEKDINDSHIHVVAVICLVLFRSCFFEKLGEFVRVHQGKSWNIFGISDCISDLLHWFNLPGT